MKNSNSLTNMSSKETMIFPSGIPVNTYGTVLFWAEEYWALMEIRNLRKKFPNIDFSGIIDPIFVNQLDNLIKYEPHRFLVAKKSYTDINDIIWENKRQFVNINTSHAPSRFIAKTYLEMFDESFAIITIDAHLDLSKGNFIHSAWLTEDLAVNTALIGGWAETKTDLEENSPIFAFVDHDFSNIRKNKKFLTWLNGKKIYITFDLDYFQSSSMKYLGYANFWHRDKVIGHSMNLKQLLDELPRQNSPLNGILLGKILGYFSDIDDFYFKKNSSIKAQSVEISQIIEILVSLCKLHSAEIISIDFVEYSPICDWQQLTFNEFIHNFTQFSSITK